VINFTAIFVTPFGLTAETEAVSAREFTASHLVITCTGERGAPVDLAFRALPRRVLGRAADAPRAEPARSAPAQCRTLLDRMAGLLVGYLGYYYYYYRAARDDAQPFIRASITARGSVIVFFAGFVLLGLAGPMCSSGTWRRSCGLRPSARRTCSFRRSTAASEQAACSTSHSGRRLGRWG
jgi:hypothetical protein